ncbi:MAG: arginyltransferase [Myxococcota bacterium]
MLTERSPAEVLVHDRIERCAYLEGESARLPLRLPLRVLMPEEVDMRLAEGDRRHGVLLYRPSCPTCRACEAIRLSTDYVMSKTQRRVLRRGDRLLRIERGVPRADATAVALYDRHRFGRGLARDGANAMTRRDYARFLAEACCESEELRFFLGDEVVAIAIVDRGQTALSAVYCHYDPVHSRLSLGTYAILKQLEFARAEGFRHLYLGLYVRGCQPMAYKARFLPHERLVDGAWRTFQR